jgi:hypothetical protein
MSVFWYLETFSALVKRRYPSMGRKGECVLFGPNFGKRNVSLPMNVSAMGANRDDQGQPWMPNGSLV